MSIEELKKVTSEYGHTLVFFIRMVVLQVGLLVVDITEELAEFAMALESISLFPSLKLSLCYAPKAMPFCLQILDLFHVSWTGRMKQIVKGSDLHSKG